MLIQSHGSRAALDHIVHCDRFSVTASALKRARQFAARKELQKQAKHEYLKQFYEAMRIDDSDDGSRSTQWIVVKQLAALTIHHSSWFQPVHFSTCAVALACCGLTDHLFWNNFILAAEHKVAAFSFSQLTHVLVALAATSFVPNLQWMERTYRQASKHIHAADPADVAGLMWAWGTLGYTPRDVLLMNQVKQISRRAMAAQDLSGQHLVALMHGLARMPKYAPNSGWLSLLSDHVQQHMGQLQPGEVVDMLLSLVVLGFKPPEPWVNQALKRIATAWPQAPQAPDPVVLELTANGNAGDTGNSAGSGVSRMLLSTALLLPPEDIVQQQLDAVEHTQQLLLPGSTAAALLHHVPDMSQEVLVDVLLGLVAIDYLPVGRLQQALLHQAGQLLPSMTPECLRRLCYALLQLQQGLEERAAAAIISTSLTNSSDYFDECLHQYKQQHSQQLADAITHRQGVILWQSSTQQLADVLAFIATSNIRPSSDYLTTAVDRAVEKLDGCPVPALCTLLWALARMGFKPHPQVLHQPDREWLRRVVMVVGGKLADGQLSQQNAAVIVWALQQLGLQAQQLIPAGQQGRQPEMKDLVAVDEFSRAVEGLVQAVA
eukprot:gene5825-6066_t